MNDSVLNAHPVSPSERIYFKCRGCGVCCRHVRQSVPLESSDVFRITRYLRSKNPEIRSTDDFLVRYAEPALLDESGFFVFFLKVQPSEESCVFLKENQCTIQQVKPKACRMYPFVAEPMKNGRFRYLVSQEYNHHFKGQKISVGRWMKQYFYPEEREALFLDFSSAANIARLMRKVPEDRFQQAVSLFCWYRYSDFNLEESFLEQYKRNLERLQLELSQLAGEQ